MNATTEFSGRSAFVTGAGTGIGAATAAELAARGAKVAMMGRRAGKLEEAAAAIRAAGGDVLILIGDVAKAKDVADAVGKTVAAFGGLHLAVNNAGVDGGTRRLCREQAWRAWSHAHRRARLCRRQGAYQRTAPGRHRHADARFQSRHGGSDDGIHSTAALGPARGGRACHLFSARRQCLVHDRGTRGGRWRIFDLIEPKGGATGTYERP